MRSFTLLQIGILAFGVTACMDDTGGIETSTPIASSQRDNDPYHYAQGKRHPQIHFQKMSEARTCGYQRDPRCSIGYYDQAIYYAKSDREYFNASKALIEFYEGQGNHPRAVITAAQANRNLPENQELIAYLVRNGVKPHDPSYVPDIGFSRGQLLAIAGAYVGAAALATHLVCDGDCGTSAQAGTRATTARTSANTNSGSGSASSGYKITEQIRYSASQTVVARGKCGDGRTFNVRRYPDNGQKEFGIGATFANSVDQVAIKFCG